ncbi:MAG: hypothetical protein AABY01_03260 [Nanoarchaeota archaeon]
MPDNTPVSDAEDNYELVPYKEIQDLKEELKRLKDVPIPSTKKLQVTMDDLAAKMDRLTAIFEEAGHEIKTEEGGLSFQEKMKPLLEKMNKILEQNSEIAKGIVAVADLVNDLKGNMEEGFTVKKEETMPSGDTFIRPEPNMRSFSPPPMQRSAPMGPPQQFGAMPPMGPPLPPLSQQKRKFGIF